MGHRLYIRFDKQKIYRWVDGKVWYGHCTCKDWEDEAPSAWYTEHEAKRILRKNHLYHKQYEENYGAPMEFIGRAHLKTVTHEIWIAHQNGQQPEFYPVTAKDYWGRATGGPPRPPKVYYHGWFVVQKNSLGYKPYGGTNEQDPLAARLDAQIKVLRYRINGYEIELAKNVEPKTITKPQAPFDRYLTELVEKSKEITEIAEAKHMKEFMDNVVALQDAVASARNEMVQRVFSVV